MTKVEVTEPALLIRIPRLYNEGMSEQALYEATRGVWKFGERRNGVQYAFAVAGGVIREVFTVEQWHPAGTAKYATRKPSEDVGLEGRWEFIGHPASSELRARYVGRSVAHYFVRGSANPVLYVNA